MDFVPKGITRIACSANGCTQPCVAVDANQLGRSRRVAINADKKGFSQGIAWENKRRTTDYGHRHMCNNQVIKITIDL